MLIIQRAGNRAGEVIEVGFLDGTRKLASGTAEALTDAQHREVLEAMRDGREWPTYKTVRHAKPSAPQTITLGTPGRRSKRRVAKR